MIRELEAYAADAVETRWSIVRGARNRRLAACDWTQLADAALSNEARAAWTDYRPALRDITQTFETPEEVVWPQRPG